MDEKQFYQTAGAILYPTKIIIETRNFVSQGSTYATTDISILATDCSVNTLGKAIIEHLQKSVNSKNDKPNYPDIRKEYLKIAKFKSEPASKRDARLVTIFRTQNSLIFRPYDNRQSEGRWSTFLGLPKEIFELFIIDSYDMIGESVRKAWAKCIFS